MTERPRPVELTAEQFRAALPDLLDVYVEAMGYPPGTAESRAPLWSDHSRRPDFRCVVIVAGTGPVLALAYGYRGRPGQWWHTEVARGLGLDGGWWLDDYFELTELHVRPDSQGRGLGEAALRRLLEPVTAQRVLLSTPEGENRAWRLYRRLGFRDVLRGFLFTGDARPFGVLGRSLPLDPPA
ncbi:MAG TPA: GNAT family N-acetyltransferase [Nakamurella sp.]|nr:GNAT family N-acetyltransferase [Nakamurella sp.]